MSTQLDPFQSALLAELRTEVAARQPRREVARGPRWKWPAAGVAAVTLATGSWLALATAAPAYAVTSETDGDVVVRIHDVHDLDGLEKALADEGVTAEVSRFDVDPGHRLVLGDELTQTTDTGGVTEMGDGLVWSDAAACGSHGATPTTHDMPVSVTHPDDHVITLAGDVVGSDSTLQVVTISYDGKASQLFVSYSVTGSGYCGAIVGLG